MPRLARAAALVLVLLGSSAALAQEETITDVKVRGAVRTDEETVRSIAGISIGASLRSNTLDIARERLHTAGLFADINVYWEPHGVGVRVVIVVKEKIPWAPVPTFSYSPGNISAGGVLAHGNLFGRGKRGLIGGRVSNVDSGVVLAYDDPAFWGSWGFFTIKGRYQSQIIPEYSNVAIEGMPLAPIRNSRLRAYGFDISVGIAWFRKVRTSFGWNLDWNEVRWSALEGDNPYASDPGNNPYAAIAFPDGIAPLSQRSARRGNATVNLTFDFRARQHAVMYGNALGFNFDYAAPRWGSDSTLWYWKASASYEHGIRFFKRHNLIVRVGGVTGENLPLWSENSAGGTNLRGYLYRQFQGDTHLRSQAEYHFPLFSLWSLDVRGLAFFDAAAIWFRKLPEIDPAAPDRYLERGDGRQFLPPIFLRRGFKAEEDVHTSAGLGLRFYLRSVAVPLVGVDFGNGIGTRDVRMILVVGN